MWKDLSNDQKRNYQKLITNFASLSEAFAQKEEDIDSIVAPIVNSKFQETAFQKCFNACAEDIANTSYDASIDAGNKKYLIGIKTFGLKSGDQKIAQFKAIAATSSWAKIIDQMQDNARGLKTKDEINKANHDLYADLAHKIASVRNERIRSSKESLRGFKLDGTPIEAVYHVLMPSSKNETPQISVGEISYSQIDINNIKIIGCTTASTPKNFTFEDGIHEYKWSSTDSQLSMKFHNTEIILEKWPVHYVKDAFAFFSEMGQSAKKEKVESHSWLLDIEPYSGFNAFYGQSKMERKNNKREERIAKIMHKYSNVMTPNQKEQVELMLETLLLTNWNSDNLRAQMVSLRDQLFELLKSINNDDLIKAVQATVYRTANELELRIPNSSDFHKQYPKFFLGKSPLQSDGKKCIGKPKDRTFSLKFMPSGDIIKAYISQDFGKAIKSSKSQGILGKWVLRDIFQLKPYEPLTDKKMIEMGINGIRLTKRNNIIELSFIWIDSDNKPDDFWE